MCGLNYIGTNAELGGCINDVNNMAKVLQNHYDFKPENIIISTDETEEKPTYNNIMKYFEMIKNKSNEYDVIYFHYSGHGTYIRDRDNEEKDRRDEALVPLDYNRRGFIIDDTINRELHSANKNCKIVMVIDACHSASMVDLRHELDCKSVKLEENQTDPNAYLYQNWSYNFAISENHNYTDEENIFTISGCRDSQTSADAWINNKYQGALSYHLMKTLELNNYKIPIKYLLKDIHCMLKLGQYEQKPVITSSKKIDLDAEFTL